MRNRKKGAAGPLSHKRERPGTCICPANLHLCRPRKSERAAIVTQLTRAHIDRFARDELSTPERIALSVVAEHARTGPLSCSILQIAQAAAIHKNIVRTALRLAEAAGILIVEPRERFLARSARLNLSIRMTAPQSACKALRFHGKPV